MVIVISISISNHLLGGVLLVLLRHSLLIQFLMALVILHLLLVNWHVVTVFFSDVVHLLLLLILVIHATIFHLVILLVLIHSLVLITVHLHIVHVLWHLLILERSQVSRWSSNSKVLVFDLYLFKLLLVFSNGEIHELKVLALLTLINFFVAHQALGSTSQQLDLLLILVLFFFHLIDSLNQIDIVLHETGVVLAVLLQVAR